MKADCDDITLPGHYFLCPLGASYHPERMTLAVTPEAALAQFQSEAGIEGKLEICVDGDGDFRLERRGDQGSRDHVTVDWQREVRCLPAPSSSRSNGE